MYSARQDRLLATICISRRGELDELAYLYCPKRRNLRVAHFAQHPGGKEAALISGHSANSHNRAAAFT